jgi:hypothetical protein
MQLPRGKFRSVIKGVALNSLIQELAEVRYTGVITITRDHEMISLVIHRGRYVLAEYGPMKGDPAWEAINALEEANVDAILSDFSDAGLKLASEFNEACLLSSPIITRAFKAPRDKGKEPVTRERTPRLSPAPVPAPEAPASRAPPASPPPPEVPASGAPAPPASPAPKGGGPPAPKADGEAPVAWVSGGPARAAATASGPGGGEAPPADGYDELALLHMEMSALDDVDVEHIATKIRKNAKGIVRKLHLGHIMTEREDEKGT